MCDQLLKPDFKLLVELPRVINELFAFLNNEAYKRFFFSHPQLSFLVEVGIFRHPITLRVSIVHDAIYMTVGLHLAWNIGISIFPRHYLCILIEIQPRWWYGRGLYRAVFTD